MGNQKRQTIDYLLYPLILVPVFFLPSIDDVFNLPKLWLLISLTLGICVHLTLNVKKISRENWKLKRLLLILILSLNLIMTCCSFLSESTMSRILWGFPSRSNGLLYFICIFVLLGVALVANPSSKFPKRSVHSLQIPFAVNLLYCSLQLIGKDPVAWSNPYNPLIGTFGNPNFSGAVLGISSAFYFFLFLNASRLWKSTYLLLGLSSFVLSLLTDSLQGPVVAVLGLGIIFLERYSVRLSKKKLLAITSSMLLAGSFFVISFLGFGPAGSFLYQYTLRLRLDYWWIALQSALAKPFTGIGPDSFLEGYFLHRSEDFVTTYGVGLRADSAHSAPLNFLASFGFISFILYLLIVLAVSHFALKLIFESPKTVMAPRVFALIWLLFLVQSLISLEQVGLGAIQWLSGGLVLHFTFNPKAYRSDVEKSVKKHTMGTVTIDSRQENKFSLVSGELAILSIVASAFLVSPPLKDEFTLRQISQANFENPEVHKEVDKEIDSLSPFALQEFRRARNVTNYYLNIGDVDKAIKILSDLTTIDPQSADAWSQIAKIENFRGRYAEEIAARKSLLALDPLNYRNILDLAKAYVSHGDKELAVVMLKEVRRLAKSNVEAIEASKLLVDLSMADK